MKSISVLAVTSLLLGLGACGNKLPEPDATGVAPTPGVVSSPASAAPTETEATPASPDDPASSRTPDEDLTAPPVPEEQRSVAPATFTGKVSYKDGTVIEITDVAKKSMTAAARVSTHKGTAGAPYYLMTIRIKNGSPKTLVVAGSGNMTLSNGDVAEAVVDKGATSDLGGKIAPGKTITGYYGWVIPEKELTKMHLEFYWDNDSDHDPAIFDGLLKTT